MFGLIVIIVLCNARRLGATLWIPTDLGSNTKCRWGAQFNKIWRKILIKDTKKPFTTVYTVLTHCPFIEVHTYYREHNDGRPRLFHLTGPTVADCCQKTIHLPASILIQIYVKKLRYYAKIYHNSTCPSAYRVHFGAALCACHSCVSHTGLFKLQGYVLWGGTYVGPGPMKS